MSIATERRQFYDSEIRVAARPRYAHVERRYWLAICRVNDEAISYLCAQPRCAQFKASACLRRLRKTGAGGRIVNMSSGAGIKGLQGSGHYNATKFAVEGISEALAQEVAPFGIAVIIVEPGPFRTDFLGRSISVAKKEMPEYAGTAGVFRTFRANNDGKQVGDPNKAVKVILKTVDSEKPPLHMPLGARAYALARTKIAEFTHDIDSWEAVAKATDYE
jgi:NAD(P)-dependent dehydrogenase (short-subunit alcohol dehydrogenase family)